MLSQMFQANNFVGSKTYTNLTSSCAAVPRTVTSWSHRLEGNIYQEIYQRKPRRVETGNSSNQNTTLIAHDLHP